MTKIEAERAIVQEWRRWVAEHPPSEDHATGRDALVFFGYVQQHKPELLSFRGSGDKWQTVHAWLLRAGLVAD